MRRGLSFWRHPGANRDPEVHSASTCRKHLWTPASAGVVLSFLLFSNLALADATLNGSSKGDPALSTSSMRSGATLNGSSKGDPALSITSSPTDHSTSTLNGSSKGDPALSTASGQPDPALCRALVKHTPAPDVNYQPGIDLHGKAVAPADLPGQTQIKMPDKIEIPLTVSLAKVLNLNTSQYPYSQLGQGTEATLGTIAVEGDKVTFNGQPLTDEQEDNLAVLCMKPQ